uniref:Cilia- and flagella-associated protein 43 n=1 Tax=Astyanax mexicanus TaxID=7994 RepID=A0A3B1JEA2_ASTMX
VLALSDAGPYLACCSSLPDYTITVWNWESEAPVCTHPLTEEDISTLAFNPVNWQQICAANSRSVTVWNIEKSNDVHIMKPSVVDLPAADGSAVVREVISSHGSNGKLTYYGPQMPTSAIAGLSGDRAENFVPQGQVKSRLCPSAICWSASSQLYVGTREGFLLLINSETLLVTVLYKTLIEGNPSNELEFMFPERHQTSGTPSGRVTGLLFTAIQDCTYLFVDFHYLIPNYTVVTA